ncbi:unnamed protein product [Rotaria sordida]|uniref:YihY/virulence factor BrkB family protein n=1 Tax=Rotaria sordida TaxID=392033 RepID=A0A814Q4R1_9BILA|nr:unnamed protein product [Rotaria sordida]CAF1329528.1 unnamed protein product [Rotaria sordida]
MINKIKSSAIFERVQQETTTARLFLKKFLRDWSLNLAAMLAYNLLISLLPMAIALFGILGVVLRNYPQVQQEIKDRIIDAFSTDNTTSSGVKQIVDIAFDQLSKEAGGILLMGVIIAFFGSSRLFVAIDKCMCIVYRVPQRPFLPENILAFGAVFVFIIIIPIMLAFSSAPYILISIIPGGSGRFGAFVAGITFSLLSAFILLELIYLYIPNRNMSFKVTWCGALVAACTLEIYIILFPLYVRLFMGNYTGQIGFAVIFILFLYYFALIIILGAQINAFFFDNYQPLVHGLGTCLSEVYEGYGIDNPNRPLCEDDMEIRSYNS